MPTFVILEKTEASGEKEIIWKPGIKNRQMGLIDKCKREAAWYYSGSGTFIKIG
jgi:hypothetical protein